MLRLISTKRGLFLLILINSITSGLTGVIWSVHAGACGIDGKGVVGVGLAAVDVGIGSSVDDEVRVVRRDCGFDRREVGDV